MSFGVSPFGIESYGVDQTASSDSTAPTLSSLFISDVTDTGATLNFTSSEAGTYYAIADESSTTPDVAEIQAGQDGEGNAADFSDTDTMTASSQTVAITGLTTGNTYHVFVQGEDAATNDSSVYPVGSFTPGSGAFGAQVRNVARDVARNPARDVAK